MAIKLAGNTGAAIGNVRPRTDITGGYLKDQSPNMRHVGTDMLTVAQSSKQLAAQLADADAEARKLRDQSTLLTAQRIFNEQKRAKSSLWGDVNSKDSAFGLNAGGSWATNQMSSVKDLLSKIEQGNVQFKEGMGMEQKDLSAFNEALQSLGPAAKLALKKYVINQNDAWAAKVTAWSLEQVKDALIFERKAVQASAGQKMEDEAHDIRTWITNINGFLDATNALNKELGFVREGDRFSGANMTVVFDQVNKTFPVVISNFIKNEQLSVAEDFIRLFDNLYLKKGEEKSKVSIRDVVVKAARTDILAARNAEMVAGQTQNIIGMEGVEAPNDTKNFNEANALNKADELLGQIIKVKDRVGNWVDDPGERKYTQTEVNQIRAAIKVKHGEVDDVIGIAQDDKIKGIIKRHFHTGPGKARPTWPSWGELKDLTSTQQRNLMSMYVQTLGLAAPGTPQETDHTTIGLNWTDLDEHEKVAMKDDVFMDKVIRFAKTGDRIKLWGERARAVQSVASKTATARAALDTKIKTATTDLRRRNANSIKTVVDQKVAEVMMPFGSSVKTVRDKVAADWRAYLTLEIESRYGNLNDRVLTFPELNELVSTMAVQMQAGRKKSRTFTNLWGAIGNQKIGDFNEMAIGLLAGPDLTTTDNSSKYLKAIASAQKSLSNIDKEDRYEVAALYNTFFEMKRPKYDAGKGADVVRNVEDLAKFANSFRQYLDREKKKDDGVFANAVESSIAFRQEYPNKKWADMPETWRAMMVMDLTQSIVNPAQAFVASGKKDVYGVHTEVTLSGPPSTKALSDYIRKHSDLVNSSAFVHGE